MIPGYYVVSCYWNMDSNKHKMLFFLHIMPSYCTQTDSEQQRQTQALDCNGSTLQIHVTPPTTTWLSLSFLWKLLSGRAIRGRLDPKSNLCSRNGRYPRAEYRDCLSTCYSTFERSQHHVCVTRAHRSLTTRQYLQSLIKRSFDRTLRDKGEPNRGRKKDQLPVGCTPEPLPSTCPHI